MRDAMTILADLVRHPANYEFYAALRLIEAANPDKPRMGESLRPQDDPVRLGQPPSLAFEPASVAQWQQTETGPVPRLGVNVLGLLGPNGPMPLHFSEYARDRLRNANDPTLSRFLDVFHHRLLSLFYRAWANAQPTVSMDRPGDDRFASYMAAMIGLRSEALTQRDSVPDWAKLHYAGRLAPHHHNAEGLAAILGDFFKVPVVIEQFVGHWMPLPKDGLCHLQGRFGGQALGQTTVIGKKVWNAQHKFRIRVGPVRHADFQRLLPGGDSMQRLADWVRNYIGDALEWDVNVVLCREDVPRLKLGKTARLGWNTWVNSRRPDHDVADLKLKPGFSRQDHTARADQY
ncbi:type VI secretion system protein ImpH [Chitinivorax tropicus]|uniref:Type VI secretion system protein ImpH n=1 Tax=Chitinivorax tropicus TaxID=714531 RepID=A0A840MNX3_9PROT|nr:type VI secretion system baseplate subunit TssG [Chitinivorax tropicus]MBB5020140.1 type VI secretion system protein ImpH [Chitinivorax tropicus]